MEVQTLGRMKVEDREAPIERLIWNITSQKWLTVITVSLLETSVRLERDKRLEGDGDGAMADCLT